MQKIDFDVVIVGLGPTGGTLANLLAMNNLSVLILEKESSVYNLPRAVHFDDEVMRVFQTIGITKTLSKNNEVLVSRIKQKDYSKILEFSRKNKYKMKKGKNTTAVLIYKKNIKKTGGKVGIIAAGTSDIGIAEEARLVCESMNCDSISSYDVGIAGLHRIFPVLKQFVEAEVDVIIVVAGMEGALASIVSSIADVPVIGVPTSIGYGYGEKGVAALASMLQSCSLGLTVVNIDNGVGAGAAAANIASRIKSNSRY